MMDCAFCKIISGDIPVRLLADTGSSVCFMDASPLARGHVLVVPKSHRERIQDMTAQENADLFGLVHAMAARVDKLSGATLLAIHNGPAAGQEVPHVHVHLVPRSEGDSAGPIHSMFGGTVPLTEEDRDELSEQLLPSTGRAARPSPSPRL